MLFEKIRRTQKPVFIFLGLVFALSFVFLGVGSGAGGISLGNLLGQSSGSGTTSVNDLLNKVHTDPKDATAWRQLGDAYQTSGQTTLALGLLLGLRLPQRGDLGVHVRVLGTQVHVLRVGAQRQGRLPAGLVGVAQLAPGRGVLGVRVHLVQQVIDAGGAAAA